MSLAFRFAVASDLHVGLSHTIQQLAHRFHLIEVSIPALEAVLDHLSQLDLDFLLLPGDLTQDGEIDNHRWLTQRLQALPFPTYVIPGNHDVPQPVNNGHKIGWQEFPHYYRPFGYEKTDRLYYTCEVLPGVRLIGLNSNQFNEEGHLVGAVDEEQLAWLESILQASHHQFVLVMIHHNVLEHLPNQTHHPIGRRYMLSNAPALLKRLRAGRVELVFTGHLHVQDIAHHQGVYDITTGSLVSYPHPYRLIQVHQDDHRHTEVHIESHRVESVPDWPPLQDFSREWLGDRSTKFMTQFLTHPPLNLPLHKAQELAPSLRYFWSTIAAGDPVLTFPELPEPVRQYFEAFSHPSSTAPPSDPPQPGDNHTTLCLRSSRPSSLHPMG
jgi:3',5'-cyclic AMP phosphodiesterase CpdA